MSIFLTPDKRKSEEIQEVEHFQNFTIDDSKKSSKTPGLDKIRKEINVRFLEKTGRKIIPKTLKDTRKFDFIIAGAKKCGTWALENFLRFHPQIQFKSFFAGEGHFFDIGCMTKSEEECLSDENLRNFQYFVDDIGKQFLQFKKIFNIFRKISRF